MEPSETQPDGASRTELYTINEIAALLRISRSSAYRLVERRELGHVAVGRKTRVTPQQFREYLEAAAVHRVD